MASESRMIRQGGEASHLFNTDREHLFRQESFFFNLFGVEGEEGFYGALDVTSGRSMLFMPRLPSSYAVWLGKIRWPYPSKIRLYFETLSVNKYISSAVADCLGANDVYHMRISSATNAYTRVRPLSL